jgi:hypothetical protein
MVAIADGERSNAMNDYFKDICDWRDEEACSFLCYGTISKAILDLKEAYYKKTGRTLTKITLDQNVFDAWRVELMHELRLKEWPLYEITFYGTRICCHAEACDS